MEISIKSQVKSFNENLLNLGIYELFSFLSYVIIFKMYF